VVLHNLYRTSNSNSLLTFELDYSPIPSLNLYGQVAIDEFRLPVIEDAPADDDFAPPDRYGLMLGAKTAMALGPGMLSASLEGVWTDPYLYLRGNKGQIQGETAGINYGNSFIVATRYHNNEVYAVEDFLGYRWGGDAIVVNLNAAYRVFGRWNAGVNLMVMIHGTHDLWTYSREVYATTSPNTPHDYDTPTTSHETLNSLGDVSGRNAAYVLTGLSLFGSWNILRDIPGVKNLELFGQVDLVIIKNPGNIKSDTLATDLQLSLGVSYSF
jgi:hypothetical protein